MSRLLFHFAVFGLLWGFLKFNGFNLDGTDCYCDDSTAYTINRVIPGGGQKRPLIGFIICMYLLAMACIFMP